MEKNNAIIITNLQNLLDENNPTLNAKLFFEEMGKHKMSWEDIIKSLVINNRDSEQATAYMQALVNYRDVIDRNIFRAAIEKIFPDQHYAYQYDDKQSKPTSYLINIYNVNKDKGESGGWLPNQPSTQPNCILTIKAPGSRTLTSDIDTTIATSYSGTKRLTIENNHLVLNHLHLLAMTGELEALPDGSTPETTDYFTRLQATLIHLFYQISEESYGMTSGEHRDSNVYCSGFLGTDLYPHFSHNVPDRYKNKELNFQISKNPDHWFFDSAKSFIDFYSGYRQSKHHFELAASLVSLHQALTQNGEFNYSINWDSFTDNLLLKVKNTNKAIYEDLKEILNLAKKLSDEREKILSSKKEERKDKSESSLINEIYAILILDIAEQNENLFVINTQINEAQQAYQKIHIKLNAYKNNLRNEDQSNEISVWPKKINKQEKELEKIKIELENLLKDKAGLLIKRQLAQVKTNLFANEAYINRSAPYHVVEIMQSGNTPDWSKQIVLGSALQQLGFFLLHAKLQFEKSYNASEVYYKNAKYLARIAYLLFGQNKEVYSEQEIARNLPRTQVLRFIASTTHWNGYFDKEDYKLFNNAISIITNVKDKKEITDNLKYIKTIEELKKRIPFNNEDNLREYFRTNDAKRLLLFAETLIEIIYTAKLEAKGNQYLWGAFFEKRVSETKNQLSVANINTVSSKLQNINKPVATALGANVGNDIIIKTKGTDAIADEAKATNINLTTTAKYLSTNAKASADRATAKENINQVGINSSLSANYATVGNDLTQNLEVDEDQQHEEKKNTL